MAQKALERLLSRTLESSNANKKNAKKLRRRQNQLVKKTKLKKEPPTKETVGVPKGKKTQKSVEEIEIENMRKEIAGKLSERVTWTKRARMEHSFEGLTPGLAPVGYDPDESDEEEPY